MASQLADAQINAKQHLQRLIATIVATAWDSLPHYNRAQVDQFLSAVIPMAAAANQQSVLLTEGYLAQALGQTPVGLDAQQIIAGIRNGATPQEVYTRPFVTVWSALGRGVPWAQAVQAGRERAMSAAATDVQLSFTHTLVAAGSDGGYSGITGYERVPDATACDYCNAAAGQVYHTGNLMPLHNYCGCGVEPITDGSGRAPGGILSRFSGPGGLQVAVHDHGELGPVLTNAADSFTGPADLSASDE